MQIHTVGKLTITVKEVGKKSKEIRPTVAVTAPPTWEVIAKECSICDTSPQVNFTQRNSIGKVEVTCNNCKTEEVFPGNLFING